MINVRPAAALPLVFAATLGCSPTQPLVVLKPGAYTFSTRIEDASGSFRPCPGVTVISASDFFSVTVSADSADVMTVRSATSADGTLMLRLTATHGSGGATAITGTVTGRAINPTQDPRFKNEYVFGDAGIATITGQVLSGIQASGSISGSIRMDATINSVLQSSACTSALFTWALTAK